MLIVAFQKNNAFRITTTQQVSSLGLVAGHSQTTKIYESLQNRNSSLASAIVSSVLYLLHDLFLEL
jgi:hypothetical protein